MLSSDLLAFYRQISQRPLTVVDLETTGHIPAYNRITEIAILQARLEDGVFYRQSTLVNPETRIPERIVHVTGITNSMVCEAPVAAIALPDFLSSLNQGVLTAHNLAFDYGFLQAEYKRLDQEFVRPASEQLCTVELARLMLSDLPSRSLPALVRHFEFAVGRSHRAAADTEACWLLAERLLTEIQNESDAALLRRFSRQWMPLKLAAQLLGCSQGEGRSRMEKAGVEYRWSNRGQGSVPMYRRGDVERLYDEEQGGAQLSFL
ncbi:MULTISPECIES: 3'-5' exonuclease [unclassified Leptolyngbya]|uniref:3'-5' exonuclease n=1 Tax=unclassified Leptolyngbya TaxID=2650499 RepID=UPI001682B4ED|nr:MULTISPECIES: 3'-5' exonuclease [unclassified Leptolyngbya]MBD1913586.1 3'-5' exonuclease [Leptolyngbya sp. FACHB-8]MBD2155757.1 3'-5' exonuclease [Leptolyngbya sp. FACHB-16]